MNPPDHYRTLGVAPDATLAEIKKRYRALARQFHPDVAHTKEAEERFREINEAYRILSDAQRRQLYDAELKLAEMRRRATSRHSAPPPRPTPQTSPPFGSREASRAQSEHRPPPVESLLLQATHAFRRMRYREAEMLCRQVMRMDRRNPAAYELLGDILRARGRADEAVAIYSYALQLDPHNRTIQAKFDRMVGRPSGPKMTGTAARAARATTAKLWEPRMYTVRPVNALITGMSLAAIVFLIVTTFLDKTPPAPSGWIPEWSPGILFALSTSGALAGLTLAINGLLARCRQELSTHRAMHGRQAAVPLGAVLLGFDVLFFYAAFLVYVFIGYLRESLSPSILAAFGVTFTVTALFALVSHAAALNVLMFGGNIVFLAFIVGWFVGDAFRASV
ncbi:MAG: J domain-containing protein [Chthonomonadales bacterium]